MGIEPDEVRGISIPWLGGFAVFDDDEASEDIDMVLSALESHVPVWSIDRPAGNTIELSGPAIVEPDDGRSMSFMLLRTPARVFEPKFIIWIGPVGESGPFVANARKRSVIEGYKLIVKPYRYGGNSEAN